MIQLDDAGWGCLLGGTLIGAYRVESNEFRFAEVPVEQFQGAAFARQDYLAGAVAVVQGLFEALAVEKGEAIQVCRGYVLDRVRDWLAGEGYRRQTVKVEGPLQVLVETALLQQLHALGPTGVDYETLTEKQGLLFWHCLRWLKGGNVDATRAVPERERLAKTGWSSYDIWVSHPYQEAKRLARQSRARRRRW